MCSQYCKKLAGNKWEHIEKIVHLFLLHDNFSYNYDNKHTKQNKIRVFHQRIFRVNF